MSSSLADSPLSSDDECGYDLIDEPALSASDPAPISSASTAQPDDGDEQLQESTESAENVVVDEEAAVEETGLEVEEQKKEREQESIDENGEKIDKDVRKVGNELDEQSKTVQEEEKKNDEDLVNTIPSDVKDVVNDVHSFMMKDLTLKLRKKENTELLEFSMLCHLLAAIALLYCGVLGEPTRIKISLVLIVYLIGIALSVVYHNIAEKAEKAHCSNVRALAEAVVIPPTPIFEERTVKMSKDNGKFGIWGASDDNIIKKVTIGSPAGKAGIKRGDKIVSINDYNVEHLQTATIFDMLSVENGEVKFVIRSRA